MTSAEFLIKAALADPLRFVMEQPLVDHTPQGVSSDTPKTMQALYERLPPDYKMVVDARRRGRGFK